MKNKITVIAIISFFCDFVIKELVKLFLVEKNLIPRFLSLIYAKNYGVAFSMLWGNRLFIIIISILLLIFLIYTIKKEYITNNCNDNLKNITFGLLIGGIIGNLFDRIIRGYVIDYISINIFGYSFPIFNLADVFITIGVILLVICSIIDDKKNKEK